MRGRKPTATIIKLVRGNPGKRRLNRAEPKPVAVAPTKPDWISARAAAIWDQELAANPPGLITSADGPLFAAWCTAAAIHAEAVENLTLGLVVKSPVKGEPMQNPFLAIVNKQALILARLGAELGLSASARSRLELRHDGKAADRSGEEKFFGEG